LVDRQLDLVSPKLSTLYAPGDALGDWKLNSIGRKHTNFPSHFFRATGITNFLENTAPLKPLSELPAMVTAGHEAL
jgi:hypothetical protein